VLGIAIRSISTQNRRHTTVLGAHFILGIDKGQLMHSRHSWGGAAIQLPNVMHPDALSLVFLARSRRSCSTTMRSRTAEITVKAPDIQRLDRGDSTGESGSPATSGLAVCVHTARTMNRYHKDGLSPQIGARRTLYYGETQSERTRRWKRYSPVGS
jgi:hypothetical protein